MTAHANVLACIIALASPGCAGGLAGGSSAPGEDYHDVLECSVTALGETCVISLEKSGYVQLVGDIAVQQAPYDDPKFELGQVWRIDGEDPSVVVVIEDIWRINEDHVGIMVAIEGMDAPTNIGILRDGFENDAVELIDQRTVPAGLYVHDAEVGMFVSTKRAFRAIRAINDYMAAHDRASRRQAGSEAPQGRVDPYLSAAAAAQLVPALADMGLEPKLEGNRITAGGHSVSIDAGVEQLGQHEDQQFITATMHLSIDGRPVPALDVIGHGVGATQQDAMEVVLYNWSVSAGMPYMVLFVYRELREQSTPPAAGSLTASLVSALEIDGVKLFAGPVGILGDDPNAPAEVWDELETKLVHAGLSSAQQHARYASLMCEVTVADEQVVSASYRIDGVDSPAAAAHVAGLDWPAGRYRYIRYYAVIWPDQ